MSDEFIIETDISPLKFNYKIEGEKCVIDISHLNILKATKIAILSSTYCFLNNFSKKLCWLVKDEEIKNAISILRLRNIESIIQKESIEKRAIIA